MTTGGATGKGQVPTTTLMNRYTGENNRTIWTIGHSTRSREEFLAALHSFQIEVLVDVRRYPGSKKYPQFNAAALAAYLPEAGIGYLPEVELGGRRKPKPNSANTAWRSESFRGYADYAETAAFAAGLAKLTAVGALQRTAYMCSEAVCGGATAPLFRITSKPAGGPCGTL